MNLALNNQTMSSREIAELTGKRHDNVKRTMENLLELGLISITQIEEPTKGGGKPTNVYHINEDDSYVVVARLSPEFTARIVKRWRELESKQQPLWMTQLSPEATIAINDLSNQLTVASGEIDRLQGVCNTITAQFATGMTAPKFCKQLNGVNVQRVNKSLVKMGRLQKTKLGLEPTSYSRDKYFKVSYKDYGEDGKKSAMTTLTLKGAKWLYRAYLSNKLPMKVDWDGNYAHVEFSE